MKNSVFLFIAFTLSQFILGQCDVNRKDCPILVTAQGHEIEPSGVIWVSNLKIAIGVSDERKDAPGYEIFWFDPNKINTSSKTKTIEVTPLLTPTQSNRFQLDDLEGITEINGEFFVIGSLSLDKNPNPDQDRWSRHQAYRFRITKDIFEDTYSIYNAKRISDNTRPDMREWVISSSGGDWNNDIYKKRAEERTNGQGIFGGINIEGLTTTKNGELIMGFRGPIYPIYDSKEIAGYKIPLLIFSPQGPDLAPKIIGWKYIKIDSASFCKNATEKHECELGIRGIDRISGNSNEYVVILGHTGEEYNRLRLISWNMDTGEVKDKFEFPSAFVAEGITVTNVTSNKVELLIVDDKEGYIMEKEIRR